MEKYVAIGSGFYPPKTGIKIWRNFLPPQLWAEVPPFPLHFGKVLLKV